MEVTDGFASGSVPDRFQDAGDRITDECLRKRRAEGGRKLRRDRGFFIRGQGSAQLCNGKTKNAIEKRCEILHLLLCFPGGRLEVCEQPDRGEYFEERVRYRPEI